MTYSEHELEFTFANNTELYMGQTLSLGCHIHNGTYLTLSLTLTITLTLLTLTVTVRVTLTLLTVILGTVVNTAP